MHHSAKKKCSASLDKQERYELQLQSHIRHSHPGEQTKEKHGIGKKISKEGKSKTKTVNEEARKKLPSLGYLSGISINLKKITTGIHYDPLGSNTVRGGEEIKIITLGPHHNSNLVEEK